MQAADIVAPNQRELDTFSAQLKGWLQGRLPQAADLAIDDISYPLGAGRSHETILVDLHWREGGARVDLGCVVRIKPTDFTAFADDLFIEQYRIMEVMHRDGRVRVAEPLWLEEDPGVLGAPFFVMKRMRGRVPVTVPPYSETGWLFEASVADRAKAWRSGIEQLAAIATVPPSAAPFLAGPEGVIGLEQEWRKYVDFIAWISRDRPWPVLQRSLDRLRANWPTNQPEGIVWGDARLGNMMFGDDFEVIAVMDWEQPSLGGALHDLAWWLNMANRVHGATADRPHMPGMGTREETIALWGELTGISTADIAWYEEFAVLKLATVSLRISELKGWAMPSEEVLAARLNLA